LLRGRHRRSKPIGPPWIPSRRAGRLMSTFLDRWVSGGAWERLQGPAATAAQRPPQPRGGPLLLLRAARRRIVERAANGPLRLARSWAFACHRRHKLDARVHAWYIGSCNRSKPPAPSAAKPDEPLAIPDARARPTSRPHTHPPATPTPDLDDPLARPARRRREAARRQGGRPHVQVKDLPAVQG
jgi:hypothetical protein